MKDHINLNEFLFDYNGSETPVINDSKNNRLLFLDNEYSYVLLRIELKNGKLSFIQTDSMNFQHFNLQISRLSEFEYEFITINE